MDDDLGAITDNTEEVMQPYYDDLNDVSHEEQQLFEYYLEVCKRA